MLRTLALPLPLPPTPPARNEGGIELVPYPSRQIFHISSFSRS
jgi:hypothetical protein